MNTQDYEAKYGEMDTGVDMTAAAEDHSEQGVDQELDQGFGQHFLITDTSGSLLPLKAPSTSSNSTPKAQRPSKSGSGGKALSASGRLVRGTGDIPCENCGRMFSSHSNKERHKREHCHKFLPLAGSTQHTPTQERWQDRWQEQEEHPCPFPDCLETFVKSVHVKRHLTSNHGVANPLQWLEDQGEQVRKVMAGVVDLEDEERLEAGGRLIGMEEGNQKEEEDEGFDYNNSSAVEITNENSQGSFIDFEEKVPPLRIKLPSDSASKSPSNAETKSNLPAGLPSSKSMQESSIGAHEKELANVVDSEEDDEADDQLEIIDENTIGKGEDEPLIGVIVNESSEDAHGEKGGDRLADKDDLEETLHD